MAKMTTALCKQLIAERGRTNIDSIVTQFCGETKEMLLEAVTNPKNWKRIDKQRDDNDIVDNYGLDENAYPAGSRGWVRCFDCKPLDDQLRCYVVTCPADSNVVSIEFEAE